MARVLTAWPASDEITRPWLGYITRPMRVVRIENFSLDEVLSAADFRSNYEVALIFSTKYEPGPSSMGSLADLDRTEGSLFRLSPRPAARRGGADSRRPHRIFRTTAGPVDRRD